MKNSMLTITIQAIRRYLCGDRVGMHFDSNSRTITFFYNGNILFTSQLLHEDQLSYKTRLYFVVLVKSTYGVVPSYITLRNGQHPFKYTSDDIDETRKLANSLKSITRKLTEFMTNSENETNNNLSVTPTGKSQKR